MWEIKVFWHKVPDTDCTLASIILTDYLNKKWFNAEVYIQGNLNKETEYLLDLFSIETPEIKTCLEAGARVALVDHNEKSQSLDNIEELNIYFVVDHHKIDFKSTNPLYIRTEPLCSTCSILYKMYKEANLKIEEKIWKMMLAWIVSDSLFFKSATTTKEDIEISQELQQITKIGNLESFALAMFDAKSNMWDIDIEELIKYDYKEFSFGNKKIWVGTIETTSPDYALWRKIEILKWLKKIKEYDNLDFILLSIVDIIWEKNTSIVLDEDTKIVEKVFNVKVENNFADLKRRLSRKKQIIPDLTEYFRK